MDRGTLKLLLIAVGVFASLFVLWQLLDLPPQERLIEIAGDYYDRYGLVTVFISAIIESLLLIGVYYPGSLVIFLGVIFAGDDVIRVAEVVLVTTVGLLIGYVINYFLGKHGWYRLLLKLGVKDSLESAQRRLESTGPRVILGSFWHPNLGALLSTAAGILRLQFKTFLIYAAIATIVWNIFWGTLAYFIGEAALSLMGVKFVMILFTLWLISSARKTTPTIPT